MVDRSDVIRKMAEKIRTSSEDWPATKEAGVPSGCVPCALCNGMCMEAETVEPDWFGRGRVIRIFSMCDEVLELSNEDFRTEFGTVEEAVREWNELNDR